MKNAKSFSKKILSLMLVLVMIVSCAIPALAGNGKYSYLNNGTSATTKYDSANITYNQLDWAVYSDEQIATALLDWLEPILADLNVYMSMNVVVATITIDIHSVDSLYSTIDGLRSTLSSWGGIIGGDIKNIDLSGTANMRRSNTSSVTMLLGLLKVVNDNADIIENFLKGSLNLGLASSFVDLYDLLGMDTSDPVLSMLRPLFVGMVYDEDTQTAAYNAAMNKTLDNFLMEDVIGVMVGGANNYFEDVNDAPLPGFSLSQTDSLNSVLYKAFVPVWNKYLKDLVNSIAVPAQNWETESDPGESEDDGISSDDPVLGQPLLEGGNNIDVSNLWKNILYCYDADTDTYSGVLNLRIDEYTDFIDSDFNFSNYSSLSGGINDFLGYLLQYFFPTYNFASNWVSGGTDKVLNNLLGILRFVADAADINIFSHMENGSAGVNLGNLEEAILPLGKALIMHLAPMIHQDTLDKMVDFESLAKYGLMEYAANIMPNMTYGDNDSYLDVIRDVIAYQMGDIVPLLRSDKSQYDVYNSAGNNTESIWDLINYALCYYAEDRGLGKFLGVNITRSNTLWQNVDNIVAALPIFSDLFYNGNAFNSQDFFLNKLINPILDGDLESVWNLLVGGFNSNAMNNRGIWELLWTNLRTLILTVVPYNTTQQDGGTTMQLPAYSAIAGSNNSPFENLLQKDTLATVLHGLLTSFFAKIDNSIKGLMWVFEVMSSLIDGFCDGLKEQEMRAAQLTLDTNTISGTLAVDVVATVTNMSIGNNRARTIVDSNGVRRQVIDQKYRAVVKSVVTNNSALTVTFTPNQSIYHYGDTDTAGKQIDRVTAQIKGTIPSSGTVAVTTTYDLYNESGELQYSNLTATDFLYVNNDKNFFETVYYLQDSQYMFSDTNRLWGSTGTSNQIEVYSPEPFVLDPVKFDQLNNYNIKFKNTSNATFGTDRRIDAVYAYAGESLDTNANNTTVAGTRISGTFPANANETRAQSDMYVDKVDKYNSDGIYVGTYWADYKGNPMDGETDCTIINNDSGDSGRVIKGTSSVSTDNLQVASLQSGIPGIKLIMRKQLVTKGSSYYTPIFQWDGTTKVPAGEYKVNLCFYTGASRLYKTVKIIVADSNGTYAQSLIDDEATRAQYTGTVEVLTGYDADESPVYEEMTAVKDGDGNLIVATDLQGNIIDCATQYYGYEETQALFNEVKGYYSKYTPADFVDYNGTSSAIYNKFYDAMVTALAAISLPVNDTNWSKVSMGYGTNAGLTRAYVQLRAAVSNMLASLDKQKLEAILTLVDTSLYNEVNYERFSHNRVEKAATTAYNVYNSGTASTFDVNEVIRQYEMAVDRMIFRYPNTSKLIDEINRESKYTDSSLYSEESWSTYQYYLAKAKEVRYGVANDLLKEDGTPYTQSNVNNYREKLMIAENLLSAPGGDPIEVLGIEITSLPTKTEYSKNDQFTSAGLKVTATMSDGSTKDVTADVQISAPDMSTVGEKTVTVTYGGFTDTFEITVKAKVYTVTFWNSVSDDDEAEPVVIQSIEDGGAASDPFKGLTSSEIAAILDRLTSFALKFESWDKTAQDLSNITSDMDVYVNAVDAVYTITYVDGDNVTDDTYHIEQGTITLPVLTKDGYNFLGWYISEESETPITEFDCAAYNDDVVLTARWKADAPTGYKVSGYVAVMQDKENDAINLNSNSNLAVKDLTITVYDEDGVAAISGIEAAASDSEGYFEIEGLANGTYILVIEGRTAITRYIEVTVNGGDVVVAAKNNAIGIVNCKYNQGTNTIDTRDYIQFSSMFGKSSADADYDVNYDLDGSGLINTQDYIIFSRFFGIEIDKAYGVWVY